MLAFQEIKDICENTNAKSARHYMKQECEHTISGEHWFEQAERKLINMLKIEAHYGYYSLKHRMQELEESVDLKSRGLSLQSVYYELQHYRTRDYDIPPNRSVESNRSSNASRSMRVKDLSGKYTFTDITEDLTDLLSRQIKELFTPRYGPSPVTDRDREKSLVRYPYDYLRIPLSWFKYIRRSKYGRPVPYLDAIHILALIVFNVRQDLNYTGFLRIEPEELKEVFGISRKRRLRALRYLAQHAKLIHRFVIRGQVPWYDRPDKTKGSYLYVLPRPAVIAAITRLSYGRLNR